MTSISRGMTCCAVRRPCLLPTPMRWAVTSVAQRFVSTEEGEDKMDTKIAWTGAMSRKYDPGTHALFRAVYKDLCEEMRREYRTKPPPPLANIDVNNEVDGCAETARSTEKQRIGTATSKTASATDTEPCMRTDTPDSGPTPRAACMQTNPAIDNNSSSASLATTAAFPILSHKKGSCRDGSNSLHAHTTRPVPRKCVSGWSVCYRRENNIVVFRRDANARSRRGRVLAYAPVVMSDPPRLNARLVFADWFAMEVLIERNNVIVHFSIAVTEANLIMRNVRVYDASAHAELMGCTQSAEWVRDRLFYDGPCLQHLELDVQNEMYDLMQDHEVTLRWAHWAARWVSYLEHARFVRWSLGVLDELIPSELRGPESDFLLPEECAELDEPVEDWLESRHD